MGLALTGSTRQALDLVNSNNLVLVLQDDRASVEIYGSSPEHG